MTDSPTTAGPGGARGPSGTGTGTGTGRRSVPYRWVAMGVILLGSFVVVLDTTVVNLGLPAMQRDFGTIEGVEWVVTAYLATVGVAQMSSGWVADHLGRKQAFIAALVTFIVGSLLCAVAPSLWVLVAARVVQGIGGGVMMPVGMATIYELFEPDERGRALGIFGIAVMAAPAVGPVLGGGLVEAVGWRWLFLMNIPIGLVAVPVAMRVLRDSGYRSSRPFDLPGLGLTSIGMVFLLVGLSLGGMEGWGHWWVIAPTLAGVAGLAVFSMYSLRVEHPLVDMRILANPVFAIGMVSLGLIAVAQYSRLVYIPLELGAGRGVSELTIGLVMLPSALGIALTMPVGGRLADKVGARLPVSIGLFILGCSFVPLTRLTPDTPLPLVSAVLFFGGLGSGLAMMAPNIVAMNAVEIPQVSQAAGLSSTSRQLSAAIGVAVLASFYATVRPDGDPGAVAPVASIEAYNKVFYVSLAVTAIALVAAQFLPGKAKALALQDDRRTEAAAMTRGEAAGTESALTVGIEA